MTRSVAAEGRALHDRADLIANRRMQDAAGGMKSFQEISNERRME
jgi:hypothetical protein